MALSFQAHLAERALALTPKVLAKPLAIVPFQLKANLIEQLLKLVLAQQQADDELAFLDGRTVAIHVTDLNLNFVVNYHTKWVVSDMAKQLEADVHFSASSQELILVAAGKEDPDSLFFQRRLCIEGDTELGLEVKNLLLSIELDTLPKAVQLLVDKLAKTILYLQQIANVQQPVTE